ncbi:alpha/beta hydrolase [Colwellia sp. 75C3]|uniref:alpha/beta hydrolase n=1 Tax=Colwellia sp. 75C3 TaxID=888425 RepID=UPI000C31D79C|nr:alpha/beta hydrolase-fold protein [Colwellia sp. 75C3]PKG81394.1 alpha/beta hydrolase [Colwellia sp. 75C3]
MNLAKSADINASFNPQYRAFYQGFLPWVLCLFILIGILFSSLLVAQESFKIPRSLVVEVTDPMSKLTYPLFIKLPKGYDKNPDKKYPVIYLTDAWYAFQIVSGATRYPMNANKMAQAIIVGMSYAKGSKGDSSRVFDYTPNVSKSWRKKTGGAAQYMQFIEQHVFKYMSKNYRVDKHNRTFIGNSLGGLFGSYVLLTKPKLFKNYILGSPSFWFDNYAIFRLESAVSSNIENLNANVFIAIGERESKKFESNYEMVNDAELFYQKMLSWQQIKLKAKIIIIPQANHQTAFPTAAIQGLQWVLGKCHKSMDCAN